MSGAWEIQETVLAAILHTDATTIAWAFGLRNLILPGGFMPIAGMPYDHARNVACQKTLECGADWLFFLDSDVIPPRDAVLRLMAHRQPIISGVYARRSPPVALPVMMRNGNWVTDYEPGSIIEVEVVGAGCLLIHRSVLEKFLENPLGRERGKPWFDWRVDMAGLVPQGESMSEDFTFCLHARRAFGYKILVDTGVVCKHVGNCQSLPGRFEALEVAV